MKPSRKTGEVPGRPGSAPRCGAFHALAFMQLRGPMATALFYTVVFKGGEMQNRKTRFSVSRTFRMACAAALVVATGGAHAAGVPSMGTWQDTLQGRDLDGDLSNGYEAYYDTALNITWLADAAYAKTSGYQPEYEGRLTWTEANAWAGSLNVHGVTGWRLPAAPPVNGVSYVEDFSFDGSTDLGYNLKSPSNELGHMFYVTLGNRGLVGPTGFVQTRAGLINTGPFFNLPEDEIWTGGIYSHPDGADFAWYFLPSYGLQELASLYYGGTAWLVRTGDVVSAVPEPSAAWLMAGGLIVLLANRFKRSA